MNQIKIGNVTIETRVLLAPLAGITDLPFRRICRELGCRMTYTEMVSAKGLHYQSRKTFELLAAEPCHPIGVQIFGSEPEVMGEIASYISQKSEFDIIDINMGCPAPKIVKNGEGSALMRQPLKVAEIVRAVVGGASGLPVTVKMRTGWDSDHINAVEISKIAEAEGAAAVTVHGRTRQQYYSGEVDYLSIAKVKEAVKIPVVGNGDIFHPADAVSMVEKTGCDAVMAARGVQGNPWLLQQCERALIGGQIEMPSIEERIRVAARHFSYAHDHYGEKLAVLQMRKHMAWYIKGLPSSTELKRRVNHMRSYADVTALINQIEAQYKTDSCI